MVALIPPGDRNLVQAAFAQQPETARGTRTPLEFALVPFEVGEAYPSGEGRLAHLRASMKS